MKEILFMIHDLGPGGAEKVLVNLVNNLDQEQFDVTVMTLFDVGENKQFLKGNVHYRTVFPRLFPGNSHVMKLFPPAVLHKVMVRAHYDIEVSYLEGPCARIISGCQSPDTKKVCWIHVEQHTQKKAAVSFRNIKEAEKCYNAFEKIICVSQTVKEDFMSLVSLKKPAEVYYNTNESDKIRILSKDEVTDCEFRADEFKLVAVGKLSVRKGFDRILRIVKKLKEEGYPIHLYILGCGSEEKNMLTYIAQNDLNNSVDMLGYQTNLYKYVEKCDLFVCASLAEGFSTAATEALILGVPVCTVEVSGMKEMLGENNEYGVVTENNEDALYQGIKRLLDSPELMEHYKNQAAIRGNTFSTVNTVRAVEKMLLEL